MTEYAIAPSPLRNINRLDQALNPSQAVNYTVFVPPTVTGEQYIIPDGTVGVAIRKITVLDTVVQNGKICVLGNGKLVIL